MQDVVDEVLKAEAKAEKIITQAKEKAQIIKQQIEQEVSQRINDARLESQKLIQNKVSKAKEQASRKHQKAVELAEAESKEFWEQNLDNIDLVIEKIVQFILIPEFERD